jgi:nucleotide-binding universal stress UspA family protein
MISKLLLAYDGSDPARRAFDLALDLAKRYGAELHILAVARPPEFGGEVETEAVIENSKQHCHQMLRPLQAAARSERTVAVHFEVAVGHPAEQIVRHAEDWKADLVVVGHRGRTFFERWLIGSVAKQVINHAPCAVLVAR